ncbi:unnamed protein product [Thlaspi arvense]|uniref:Probable purine permease n=1 Tax=Thlaspi arvense TaxID=13288 RepID=A0AAU9RFM2_THLAR|nr:unnamed protein product [Thlaspi arvense]
MGEAPEVQMQIVVQETKETSSSSAIRNANHHASTVPQVQRWLKIAFYSIFVLAGQSVATLLGRLYFEQGGSMLFAVGLQYLPASTFSLISASQLGFNALFSFFLNSQKLTPFIINSLVVLTISSTLLVFNTSSSGGATQVSKRKYTIGFLCTLAASAGYSLMLSLSQLFCRKILRKSTFDAIIRMIIYQMLVATFAIVVGLFASGEWKGLRKEMDEYALGKVSYVMTLVWTAICWQVFSIGAVGLIFNVSSLFCNVISTLTLPIVPVFAVIFFHDKMDGVKVISLLLAVWGFVSYIYQHYLEDFKSKVETRPEPPEVSSIESS